MSPDGEIVRFKDGEKMPKGFTEVTQSEVAFLNDVCKSERHDALEGYRRDGSFTKAKFDKKKVRKMNKKKRKQQ